MRTKNSVAKIEIEVLTRQCHVKGVTLSRVCYHMKLTCDFLSRHNIERLRQNTAQLVPVGGSGSRCSCQPSLNSAAEENLRWQNVNLNPGQLKMTQKYIETKYYLPLNNTSNQQASPCILVPTDDVNFKGISISYSSSSWNMIATRTLSLLEYIYIAGAVAVH